MYWELPIILILNVMSRYTYHPPGWITQNYQQMNKESSLFQFCLFRNNKSSNSFHVNNQWNFSPNTFTTVSINQSDNRKKENHSYCSISNSELRNALHFLFISSFFSLINVSMYAHDDKSNLLELSRSQS